MSVPNHVMWHVASLLLLFVALCASSQPNQEAKYCVVIDAGSTGSRVHVYTIAAGAASELPLVQHPSKALKNSAGLSKFSAYPSLAGESLQELVSYAQAQVPPERHANTDIHLLATAGLRMLSAETAEAILNSCREILSISGFRFRPAWASVLSGPTEGIYGWISANYASGALQDMATRRHSGSEDEAINTPLLGVLELGGASFQVTFQAEPGMVELQPRLLTLGPLELLLFTHSFLGFGQDTAQQLALRLAASHLTTTLSASNENQEQAVEGDPREHMRVLDPCLPRGYVGELFGVAVEGGGYFGLCRQVAAGLVMGNCSSVECGLGGILLPPLTGMFVGIENFQYTANFLGLPQGATVGLLAEAGQDACSISWPEMLERFAPKYSAEHLLHYCFGAAYAVALLHDGLGFGLDDSSLLFTDTVQDRVGNHVLLDWTLGAVVMAAASGNLMAGLATHFPEANRAPAYPTLAPAAQQGVSPPELLLMAAGLLGGASFCIFAGRRQSGLAWKRKRRKGRRAIVAMSGEDADDESDSCSDSQLVRGEYARRHHLVLRGSDLEAGGL